MEALKSSVNVIKAVITAFIFVTIFFILTFIVLKTTMPPILLDYAGETHDEN